MMKKVLLIPFCCVTLLGCGPSSKLYSISISDDLFDVEMSTYLNQNKQIVKAYVEDSSDTNYLIYLVDENGVVTNAATTNKRRAVYFIGISSDSHLCVSKTFNSSLVNTGVTPTMINGIYPDYYNDDYTSKVKNKIDDLKANNTYTDDKPLYIYNAYGTDELSMYFYFNTEEKKVIEYKVVTTNHYLFSREVKTDFNSPTEYSKEHEFTAHGMIAGETNYVLVNSYSFGELQDSRYVTYQPKSLETMDQSYKGLNLKKETYSSTPLSNGLFALSLGQEKYTKNRQTHTSLIDNNGDIRWFIPMNDFFFNNIFFQEYNGEKCLVYVIDYHQLVYVNYLGQTKKIVTLLCPDTFSESGAYKYFTMHHDFCFDNNGNLLILAGKCAGNIIEDKNTEVPKNHGAYVIKYNINTDQITVPIYIDKSLLTNYKPYAMEKITEKSGAIWATDWFHPNTVQFFEEADGDYITLSSRESSSVMRIKLRDDWPNESTSSIANPPQIKWIITNNKNITTKEPSLNYLTKIDTLGASPTLGQHTTYIVKDNIFPYRELGNSEYYLVMYSNNTTMGWGQNDYDDFKDVSQKERDLINKYSKNRVYLINEANNTYECVYNKNVPYAPFMASFIYYKNRFISQSTANANIIECDTNGNTLANIKFIPVGSTKNASSYRSIKIEI